jgi:hypothetical protein
MIIHDIEVDDVSAGGHDIADFLAKAGKVGGQDARSDAVGRHGVSPVGKRGILP